MRTGGRGTGAISGSTGTKGAPFSGFAASDDHIFIMVAGGDAYLNAPLLDPATVVSGYGGFEAVDVPGQRQRPIWRGADVLGVQVSLLLDGWLSPRRAINGNIVTLEYMAGVSTGFEIHQPPELVFYGSAVPHNANVHPHYRWVIGEFAWLDDPAPIGLRGQWYRRAAQFTLWRQSPNDPLRKISPSKPHPKYHTILSQEHDTYNRIAKRELKTARLGTKLARYNGARDPSRHLPKHTRVKVPNKALADQWKHEIAGRR